MKINNYGQVEISDDEAFRSLYEGKISNLDGIYLEDLESIHQYNLSRKINADRIPELKALEKLNISLDEFDKQNQEQWFMPNGYFPNLEEWLYNQCQTSIQKDRVREELSLFAQYGMIDLLHYIKYLIDTMRKEGIVWGVGRGSSVASYVLYLIGVHKVDSIKYNLDIREFLK